MKNRVFPVQWASAVISVCQIAFVLNQLGLTDTQYQRLGDKKSFLNIPCAGLTSCSLASSAPVPLKSDDFNYNSGSLQFGSYFVVILM